jgi:hypothetical protein
MAYNPPTRVAQDVMSAVKRQFGDEAGVQIEDADIYRWINDAQDEINKRNRVLKASASGVSVAGTAAYSFPATDILQIESLHYDGARLENVGFAQAEDIIISKGSALDSGTPQLWYEWGGKFTLWPKPSTAASILVYYTQKPVRVTAATDLLSLPDKYYNNVVQYVLQQAYEMDEDWQASQAKQQQFDAAVADLGEEERTAQNMTYNVITLVD